LKGVRFAVDSELGNVSLVAAAVNSICALLGLNTVSAGEVELCIAEAATNAIRHAYHDQPGQTVAILLSVTEGQLQIEVSDNGSPMPAEQERRLLHGTQNVEFRTGDKMSLAEGGRGLQIIHDLMDEVSYVRTDNVNRLRMTKEFQTLASNEGSGHAASLRLKCWNE
jgi:serine/threonine-protein kinase RsbW